jgi:hypothetical protein
MSLVLNELTILVSKRTMKTTNRRINQEESNQSYERRKKRQFTGKEQRSRKKEH